MKKEIAIIGLGKMGIGIVERLLKKDWEVVAFDTSKEARVKADEIGAKAADSLKELAASLKPPRLVWIMVPAGKPVDDVLKGMAPFLAAEDIVIDAGNSYFKDSQRRAKELVKKGIFYLDVGGSGGPVSVREGKFAIMVVGQRAAYDTAKPIFDSLSDKQIEAFKKTVKDLKEGKKPLERDREGNETKAE